mmetsp:Transcript_18625/g.34502  ORF Transcript_18625/g.34502 Transcript_18625/m.34502 type:complete len:420 (-) Transcript_18625:270-1529(-)
MVRFRSIRILRRHHRQGLLPPQPIRKCQHHEILHGIRRRLPHATRGRPPPGLPRRRLRPPQGSLRQHLPHGLAHLSHGVSPLLRDGGVRRSRHARRRSSAAGHERGRSAHVQPRLHAGEGAARSVGAVRELRLGDGQLRGAARGFGGVRAAGQLGRGAARVVRMEDTVSFGGGREFCGLLLEVGGEGGGQERTRRRGRNECDGRRRLAFRRKAIEQKSFRSPLRTGKHPAPSRGVHGSNDLVGGFLPVLRMDGRLHVIPDRKPRPQRLRHQLRRALHRSLRPLPHRGMALGQVRPSPHHVHRRHVPGALRPLHPSSHQRRRRKSAHGIRGPALPRSMPLLLGQSHGSVARGIVRAGGQADFRVVGVQYRPCHRGRFDSGVGDVSRGCEGTRGAGMDLRCGVRGRHDRSLVRGASSAYPL